ncbi:hypothetical protein ScPMuIL_003034 [Solemya velum]
MTNIIILCLCIFPQVFADFAVLGAREKGKDEDWRDHCIVYNPQFDKLPGSLDTAVAHRLVNHSGDTGCHQDNYNSSDVKGGVVAVARGNCTFSEKAMLAQSYGATALIIIEQHLFLPGADDADYKNINISVATLTLDNFLSILNMGENPEVVLFAPLDFDPNSIIIFLIAVICVTAGGYWSGISKYKKLTNRKNARKSSINGSSSESESQDDNDEDNETVDVSVPVLTVFFVLICGFIVLLYFFYDQLVYVIISLFCLAGAMGTYHCLVPLWRRIIPINSRLPPNRVPFFSQQPEIRNLVLLSLCCGLAITWGILRNESYAWILQDILGMAFCINMLKVIHIPSFRICLLLLLLLFVYDIFFVFITPFITANGNSIMVDVATGGKSHSQEQLPMVFKVPRLGVSFLSVCPGSYSLLGFGDIIVPGLLAGYNHAFDLRVTGRKIYFISTVIAYSVGLVITFLVLYFTDMGQPALLYLVPCTVLTTVVIGWKRGELKQLWKGETRCEKKDEDINSSQTIPPPSDHSSVNPETMSISSSGSENQNLLSRSKPS